VKCWGRNAEGQLGYGDTTIRGDTSNEMGSFLPFVPMAQEIMKLEVGGHDACAQFITFDIVCWGNNNFGNLGYGDTQVRGDDGSELGDYLPVVNVGPNILSIDLAVGKQHTCIISDLGFVKCWGRSNYGQLGYEDSANRGDGGNEMGSYLPFVDLGSGEEAFKVEMMDASSCALLKSGGLKCWGKGDNSGELGQGSLISLGNDPSEMGSFLPPINFPTGTTISDFGVGRQHGAIITSTGTIFCWGYNLYGQLGVETTLDEGDQPNEMGDYLVETDVGTAMTVIQIQMGFFTLFQYLFLFSHILLMF